MFVVGTSSTFITRVLTGCLPGSSGSTHTPLRPSLHEVAVRERVARHVEVLAADVADDDADVADRDLGQRHLLDADEPRIQVPRAREQHVLLQAAAAAGVDERLAALEAVVPVDVRAGEVARRNRAAVEHGHDADAIGRHLVDAQIRRRHVVIRRRVARHDLEQRRVDPVRAGGQERELPAAFAAVAQERLRVLEVVARDLPGQHALRRNRRAVGRDDQRDLTGGHDHDRHLLDACSASASSRNASRAAASAPDSRLRRRAR